MPLVAIPNVSESAGREISILRDVIEAHAARVLDTHVDEEHGRAVFTSTGSSDELIAAMTALAIAAAEQIDLEHHRGAHPRVGVLDVCPFVPHEVSMPDAVAAARETARRIGNRGIPVFLYGEASEVARSLPEIRSGGLPGLLERMQGGLRPDEGPERIDPSTGVVCVGARDVLIAFNVWIDAGPEVARQIAMTIRTGVSGVPGVRALGLDVSTHGGSQISMNLVEPATTGIEEVFERIEEIAEAYGALPVATEIVGLVPERFLPHPDAKAARLLIEPGRSLESALRS